MPKRGENIRKRKDGRWEGRYIKNYAETGKAIYTSVYAKSYREVKQKLLEHSHAKGLEFDGQTKYQTKVVFEDVLNNWLSFIKIGIRPSTYVKYFNVARNHIIQELGAYQIVDINNKIINQFILKKHDEGRLDGKGGLSNSTLKTISYLIQSVMKYAEREEIIQYKSLEILMPSAPQNEIRVLDEQQQKCLESELLIGLDCSKLGIFICLYTGLRIGEICSLRWEDIDLENGRIQIHRTMQRIQNFDVLSGQKTTLVIGMPKSQKSNREIPIPSFLKNLLVSSYPKFSSGYVLTKSNTKPMEPRTYQNKFKMYLKNAGLPNFNFHVLRHTFATRCVKLGFDPKTLSEILGHSSVSITLNRYVHSSFDMKRSQMERLFAYQGQNSGQTDS